MAKSSHKAARENLFDGSDHNSSTSGNVSEKQVRQQHMLQARKEMQTELHKLRTTASVIEESSKSIGSVRSKYQAYKLSIANASNTLKQLKTKMENDDKYIYYSFLFFLCVSGYIFLKRVKIITITQWFVSKGIQGSNFIYSYFPSTADIPTTVTITTTLVPTTTTYISSMVERPTDKTPTTYQPSSYNIELYP